MKTTRTVFLTACLNQALGHLLALTVPPVDQDDHDRVATMVEQVRQVTGSAAESAYVDRSYKTFTVSV